MQGDSELRPQAPPRRNLWALPKITRISIERRQYRPARKHAVTGKIVERTEGIEIVVQTDGAIPVRALSPALYVGSVEIAENEQVDATTYRFFVGDERALRAGAPIVLGWVGHAPSRTRSNLRYEPPPEVTDTTR
ncbi:MAG TPA: hypothetical protein VGA51_13825 [Casimicrobiaceae bacterium]